MASVLGWQFGAIALVVALLTALAAGRVLGIGSVPGRNVAIDGFRGYLAFGVMLHHATIWYFYVRGAAWAEPPDSIYKGLGAICVSLFFMITAYLFVGKLLDARERSVDWLGLYVSRILRLTPLYLLAMCVLFFMVAALSDWQLREPISALFVGAFQWVTFSIFGRPQLNGVESTGILIALVTWTLAYEWLFYLSLPAIAVVLRAKVPWIAVFVATLLVVVIVLNMTRTAFPSAFLKGAVAAYIARQPKIASMLRRPAFGSIVLVTAWAALFWRGPGHTVSILLAVSFCIIACGNTAFGLLSNRAAIVLGDISYGVYLLHGLVLSATFLFILHSDRAAALSPVGHWLVVIGAAVCVVVLAALTYRLIEVPCMRRAKSIVEWHRRRPGPIPAV
jgi:peptidoglycan/LPS O-acetylase OafA/YrhL